MRIDLRTREKNLLYLNGELTIKKNNLETRGRFIVDTGSPKTIINYSVAKRLKIDFEGLKEEEIIGIGSKEYQSYSYFLKIILEDNEGKTREEEMEVRILGEVADEIPTIIGNDFLKEKGYTLFCDFVNETAYLER